MGTFNIYLMLPGTTREAFGFYEALFGGQRTALFTFADMAAMGLPAEDEQADLIAHTALELPNMTLMGSDSTSPITPSTDHSPVLLHHFTDTREDADRIFSALAEGGTIIRPIVDAPYGYYDGSCIDRFGIAWNIMYEHET